MRITVFNAWVVGGWVLLLVCMAGCDRTVPVVHRVGSQGELNTILVYFDRLGIRPVRVVAHTQRRETYWEVRVYPVHVEPARALLRLLDLPREAPAEDGGSSGSLIPSPDELEQQQRRQVQRRLETALEMYDAVVRARVLIAPPRRDALTNQVMQPASASVVIRYVARDGAGPPVLPEQVQQLVAGAVQSLVPDRVEVSYAPVTLPPAVAPVPENQMGLWGPVRLVIRRHGIAVALVLLVAALSLVASRYLTGFLWGRRRRRAAVAGRAEGRQGAVGAGVAAGKV